MWLLRLVVVGDSDDEGDDAPAARVMGHIVKSEAERKRQAGDNSNGQQPKRPRST